MTNINFYMKMIEIWYFISKVM